MDFDAYQKSYSADPFGTAGLITAPLEAAA